MATGYNVQITIKSVTKGECSQGFKPGDTWLIKENKTPGGMCLGAFNAIFPALQVFRTGGEQHWDEDKDVTCVSCPDPKHQLIFELKRLRED